MSNPLFIFIIVLVFYIIILQYKYTTYYNFMSGFWSSDTTFCEESNIQEMIFYIDNENHTIKILIQQEDKNLENTTYDSKFCKLVNSNNLSLYSDCVEYSLKLEEQEESSKKNVMCGEYTAYLSLSKGIITLSRDDVVYAMLYKDNFSSSKLL